MTRILVLTFLLLVLFTGTIHSQTATPSATPVVENSSLQQLQNDYRYQLEKYRESEEKFHFERAEFYKLGTLASQEDAVEAMKGIMTSRAHTMSAYIGILQNLLDSTQNLNPEPKAKAADQLSAAKLFVDTHEQEVPKLFEKENVLYASKDFEDDTPIIFEAQYRTLSLLAINRVQAAFNRLSESAILFDTVVIPNISDEVTRASAQRGLKEVSQLIQDSVTAIEKANTALAIFDDEKHRSRNPDWKQDYSNVVKELVPAHSKMKRAIEFLIELEVGARWWTKLNLSKTNPFSCLHPELRSLLQTHQEKHLHRLPKSLTKKF